MDIDTPSSSSLTLPGNSVTSSLFLRVAENNVPGINQILDENPEFDVNLIDQGKNALMVAAQHNNPEAIHALMARPGCKLKHQENGGFQAVHHAGGLAALEALYAYDRSIVNEKCHITASPITTSSFGHEDTNQRGITPLHLTAKKGNLEMTTFLVEADADINALSPENNSALIMALQSRKGNIATFLLQQENIDVTITNQQGVNALHFATKNGDLEAVKLLIAKKADINAPSPMGTPPLLMALQDGHCDIASHFLTQNNIDINATNAKGITAFHMAANKGNLENIELLLVKGVDVNAPDPNGNSALIRALQGRKAEIASYLLEKTDVTIANAQGETALHFACRRNHKDLVLSLIDAGADITALAANGQTAMQQTASKEIKNILDFASLPGTSAMQPNASNVVGSQAKTR